MKISYDEMVRRFETKDCKLITSRNDYEVQFKITNHNAKLTFTASCGHKRTSIYKHMLKNEKWICKECTYALMSNNMKLYCNTNPNISNRTEYRGYSHINNVLISDFEIIKMFEGSKSDFLIRPRGFKIDEWLQIQLKTTNQKWDNNRYQFSLGKKDYSNMVVINTCIVDNICWIIDGSQIKGLKTLTVSISANTKYKKYQYDTSDISPILLEIYIEANFHKIKLSQQYVSQSLRELEFTYAQKRTVCLNLPFIPSQVEGMSYDFMLNNKRVQEKLMSVYHRLPGRYEVNLRKSNGRNNKKIPYAKGDNDYYWFHIPNKDLFYVIPEYELIKYEFIKTQSQSGKSSIGFYPFGDNKNKILSENLNQYIYDYSPNSITKLKKQFDIR